ncbi:hypothetical protein [Paenibacillus sp. LHD-38]|uniref:hypothetical protein n=1 Tax=Paenibacillus sp. LHD-38 TaxID=3072143 RepID=UPI00280CC594|nr:hypothetical protein [Paenibacillus sp. LHD-38]MDQ8737923.1 hypothetical protein [Paenibacillus sp. LHD-38]
MEKLMLKIGEHFMQAICASSDAIHMLKKNFQYLDDSFECQPDLSILLEDGYGTPFVDYEVMIIKECNRISFQRADYSIQVDADYTQATVAVHDELALKHALMNLYSSFIVHRNWGLLIHSSCVIEEGRAHVFMGHSGAGKSTAAKLSYPRKLLSDEATILKISEESITVFNSPFRSELQSTDHQENCPLASMQLLEQSRSNKRLMLKKSEALLQITDKVFFWSYRAEEPAKIFRLLKLVVNEIPVYELHFQKNNIFWELIS